MNYKLIYIIYELKIINVKLNKTFAGLVINTIKKVNLTVEFFSSLAYVYGVI